MALRDSGLDDEAALETFCQTVTGALSSEDHYLILLAHERYDVPFKAKRRRAAGRFQRGLFLRSVRHMPRKARQRRRCGTLRTRRNFTTRAAPTPWARRSWAFCSRHSTAGEQIFITACIIPAVWKTITRSWCRRCSSWTRPSLRTRKRVIRRAAQPVPRGCVQPAVGAKSMSSYARTLRHIKN